MLRRFLDPVARLPAGPRSTLAALVAVAAIWALTPSYSLGALIMIFAIATLGCNLLLGYTGLLSFGQGIFFGFGGYLAGLALVHLSVPVPAALVVGALAGFVSAVVVGYVAITRRGIYFVMLTFAFAQMFSFLVFVLKDVTGGENGLRGFPPLRLGAGGVRFDTSVEFFVLSAAVFVGVYVFLSRVVRSPLGATLAAIKDNEDRVIAIGYHTRIFKVVAFGLSGMATGLAGCLYALYLGSVPAEAIELATSETILIMTILGGTGSLFGSVLGAVVYLVLSDYLATTWDRWQLLLGVGLIAVVLYAKGGIWGIAVAVYERVVAPRVRGPGAGAAGGGERIAHAPDRAPAGELP